MPAWRRPDFLHATLTRLAAADDPALRYLIALDRGFAHAALQVVHRFTTRVGPDRVSVVRRVRHRYRGNSFNVLTGYREALAHDPTLVHLVEEDVLVAADYFDFHRRAHDLAPDVFAVSGCRNQQFLAGHDPPPDPDAAYLHRSYQSIGVSFRPARLAEVLIHATRAYLIDPIRYCRTHFPGSAIFPGNAEQDGLAHRVLEAGGRSTLYPALPRAYHCGFMGYHRRGTPLTGGIFERGERLLTMTAEDLNGHALTYPDHTVVPLDVPGRPPLGRLISWP